MTGDSLKQWFWYALAGMFLIRDLRGKDFPKSTQNDKMALIYKDFEIGYKDLKWGRLGGGWRPDRDGWDLRFP